MPMECSFAEDRAKLVPASRVLTFWLAKKERASSCLSYYSAKGQVSLLGGKETELPLYAGL